MSCQRALELSAVGLVLVTAFEAVMPEAARRCYLGLAADNADSAQETHEQLLATHAKPVKPSLSCTESARWEAFVAELE